MAIPRKPRYPVALLATFELRDYREQLEHAMGTEAGHDAAMKFLRTRLAEVLAEQKERADAEQADPESLCTVKAS
jgi:hypothetical protein